MTRRLLFRPTEPASRLPPPVDNRPFRTGEPAMSSEGGRITDFIQRRRYTIIMELRAKSRPREHVFPHVRHRGVCCAVSRSSGRPLPDMLARQCLAFAIWDAGDKDAARSPRLFGIKPFYYTFPKTAASFSAARYNHFSNHPGFPETQQRAAPYLTLQYSAAGGDVFRGLYKLPFPRGTKFVYDTRDRGMKKERFWDVIFESDKNLPYPPDVAIELEPSTA